MVEYLRTFEKIGAVFLCGYFTFLNYQMMVNQTLMLKQAYLEIAKFSQHDCCGDNSLITHMTKEVSSHRFKFTYLLLQSWHLIMFVLSLVSIIFDRKLNDAKNKPH